MTESQLQVLIDRAVAPPRLGPKLKGKFPAVNRALSSEAKQDHVAAMNR